MLKPGVLQPVLRELVFDIDVTDYDAIRTCCVGKDICRSCWGFISAAVKVIDFALRDQFGFEHLLWVYSGRRGIHCWVLDEDALYITDDQRKAVLEWLNVTKSTRANTGFPKAMGRHPAIQDALGILEPIFRNLILKRQDCFADKEKWSHLLEFIEEKDIINHLSEQWTKYRSSLDKWEDFEKEIEKPISRKTVKQSGAVGFKAMTHENALAVREDVILHYTYPRLDNAVTEHRHHLLKAPFCVHPATGRVCVPIDPKHVEDFDPEAVPTIVDLLRELNHWIPTVDGNVKEHNATERYIDDSEGSQARLLSDWEKTSLKPYVEMFQEHIRGLTIERSRTKPLGAASLVF